MNTKVRYKYTVGRIGYMDIDNILRKRFNNYDYMVLDKVARKPSIPEFRNAELGSKLLQKHIVGGSRIAIHADVDLDGIGSALIMYKFISKEMRVHPRVMINRGKCHGILEGYKDVPIDLLIVVDSSSNLSNLIEEFNCDVIVLDHHIVDKGSLIGNTRGGEYCIINNTVENVTGGYEVDYNYSAGMVVYEFLRYYLRYSGAEEWIHSELLYQWAVVTLISDIISMDSERNQYYANLTLYGKETESSLSEAILSLNKYSNRVTKSVILYKIAPQINRAIRAGAGERVLEILLNSPGDLCDLDKDGEYKEEQDKALSLVELASIGESYGYVDMTGRGVSSAYSGVIASGVLNTYSKTAVAFSETGGLCKGSFRGKYVIDYKRVFQGVCNEELGEYAQGHLNVFGFAIERSKLLRLLYSLKELESKRAKKPLFTVGDMRESYRGEYHIESLNILQGAMVLSDLGIVNSKLSSREQVMLYLANGDNVTYKEREYSTAKARGNTGIGSINKRGVKRVYDVYIDGVRGVAFDKLTSDILEIDIEFTSGIGIIVKNHSNYRDEGEI